MGKKSPLAWGTTFELVRPSKEHLRAQGLLETTACDHGFWKDHLETTLVDHRFWADHFLNTPVDHVSFTGTEMHIMLIVMKKCSSCLQKRLSKIDRKLLGRFKNMFWAGSHFGFVSRGIRTHFWRIRRPTHTRQKKNKILGPRAPSSACFVVLGPKAPNIT